MQKTDEELMEAFAAGDAAAFDTLFERFRSPLHSYISGMLPAGHSAEDAFQETFIRIIRNVRRFDTDRKFSSWAFRIAGNVCSDTMRKESRQAAKNSAVAATTEITSPGPEKTFDRSDRARRIREHVAALPPEHRQVVMLREFAGLPFREIADIMDCPLSTAIGRMRDALIKLKTMMDADGTAT